MNSAPTRSTSSAASAVGWLAPDAGIVVVSVLGLISGLLLRSSTFGEDQVHP